MREDTDWYGSNLNGMVAGVGSSDLGFYNDGDDRGAWRQEECGRLVVIKGRARLREISECECESESVSMSMSEVSYVLWIGNCSILMKMHETRDASNGWSYDRGTVLYRWNKIKKLHDWCAHKRTFTRVCLTRGIRCAFELQYYRMMTCAHCCTLLSIPTQKK